MYPVEYHAEPELYPCREPQHLELVHADQKDCAAPNPARRKRVTFADADTFQSAYLSPSSTSSSNRRDLYWSRLEKRQFVARAQCRARQVQGQNPAHLRSVADAWHSCHSTTAVSALSRTQLLTDVQALIQWSDSRGRGLEHKVFVEWRQAKHFAVRKIVLHYEYLQSHADHTMDVSEALRVFSERRSFRAREFAVKLAIADVLVLDR
jgi:hypothetical protein